MAKYAVSASSRSWMNMRYEVHIVPDGRNVECEGNHISSSDNTDDYDINNYEYGESWKKLMIALMLQMV